MMPAMAATDVQEIRTALREMLAAQRRLRGREAQRQDQLSYSQHGVLRVLADGDLHSAGELAAAADLTPASMTKMLDGLERAGLVQRVRDEVDRRRVAVRITAAGREVHDAKDAAIGAAWEEIVGPLEPEEAAAMAVALRRIAALYDAL
jgi:DNA-binding MarR family transcriptional regulator